MDHNIIVVISFIIFIYELFNMPRYFEESVGHVKFNKTYTNFRVSKRSELSVVFYIFILSLSSLPLYVAIVTSI